MRDRGRKLWAVAGVSLAGAVACILVLTRPRPPPVVRPGTHIERLEGELPAARDEQGHYAPGSPAAVSEAFLRLWWRAHYEDARALAAGEIRARCERDLQKTLTLGPDERETMRQVQVIAEAAQFDLERATVSDMAPDDGGVPRKQVRGEVHAHGRTPDGHPVESRRVQTLVLALVDGGWKVTEWTPSRAESGIQVQ